MKERSIRFNGWEVRATLAGQKTQALRVIVPSWFRCLDPEDPGDVRAIHAQCPYGVPGDYLWVQETFCYRYEEPGGPIAVPETFLYRADDCEVSASTRWLAATRMPRRAGPRAGFMARWDATDGKRLVDGQSIAWAANPRVWVLTYSVVR